MKFFLSWMLIASCFFPLQFHAQAPATDIYLFDISLINGRVNFVNPMRITDREGYDNQPCFTADSRHLLFSSDRAGDGQTDIYQYSLTQNEVTRLTTTAESEYSPQPIPGKRSFSVVQVEADGETQRIWKFAMKAGKAPKVILPQIKTVGYYAWIDRASLVTFLLPEPFQLKSYFVDGRVKNLIASNVGRSIHLIPNEYAITYVDKSDSTDWKIQQLGLITGKTTTLVSCLAGQEDFCWSSEGYMLMGFEKKLYMFIPGKDSDWRFVGDLGVGDFYRLAVSPDGTKLAVVVYR